MQLQRQQLGVLLNALHDHGVSSIPVSHPSAEIGELVRIELEDNGAATVRFTQGALTYGDNRDTIQTAHGMSAYEDLPDAQTYLRAMVASGLVQPQNIDEIAAFVDRYGYADLEAGNEPVVVGLDANIMPWQLPRVLEIDTHTGSPDHKGRKPTNGYALATGVKEELDWHYKQYNTRELTAAFGAEFERLDSQPAGDNREGLLGLYAYRRLPTTRSVDIIDCEPGDDAIVAGYQAFHENSRKSVVLLSNDHGFIDRSLDAGVPAQHIEFPVDLPRKTTASWRQAGELLYYFAILFGVIRVPKVTLYGVWDGKDGRHWLDEQLTVDCRSPKVEPQLVRDLTILDATN